MRKRYTQKGLQTARVTAQERHIRLETERVKREERQLLDDYQADIEAFAAEIAAEQASDAELRAS